MDQAVVWVELCDVLYQLLFCVGGVYTVEYQYVEIGDVVVIEDLVELVRRVCGVALGSQDVNGGDEHTGAAADDENAFRLVLWRGVHCQISLAVGSRPATDCGWPGSSSAPWASMGPRLRR